MAANYNRTLLLESLLTDVRFALRWLRKSPAFTLVAIASLSIGIGFNTALFAITDALLFKPLPVAEPSELVDVFTSLGRGAARCDDLASVLDARARLGARCDRTGAPHSRRYLHDHRRGAGLVQRHGPGAVAGDLGSSVGIARRRAGRDARCCAVAGRHDASRPARRSLAVHARTGEAAHERRGGARESRRADVAAGVDVPRDQHRSA